ncbi:MAG: hypothetical protein JF630_08325, partial [Geodermatophilales bacterium]|nr:hypothetical protein [Geodermatophilales bacterium]
MTTDDRGDRPGTEHTADKDELQAAVEEKTVRAEAAGTDPVVNAPAKKTAARTT